MYLLNVIIQAMNSVVKILVYKMQQYYIMTLSLSVALPTVNFSNKEEQKHSSQVTKINEAESWKVDRNNK